MSPTEPSPRTPSVETGLFATLASLLHIGGWGTPSLITALAISAQGERALRHLRRAALSLATVGIAALLLTSTASADSSIGGATEFPANLAAGGIASLRGVAVSDKEGGDIYAVDGANNQRIDQFEPDGTFVRAFGWGVVPGAAAGTGTLVAGSTSVSSVSTTLGQFYVGQIVTGSGIPADTMITEVNSTELILSNPATASAAAVALTVAAGPGNVPVNEQQKLTVSATTGEFSLTFRSPNPSSTSATTTAIPAGAPASGADSVQEALEGLPDIGAGNVSVTGGPGDEEGEHPYLISFQGRYADTNVNELSPTDVSLSGGSPSSQATVTTTREGAGVLETCTTLCIGEAGPQGFFERGEGSNPGQLRYSEEVAIDNDPSSTSYGDVYVVDQRNYRIEKYSSEGELLLMIGGEIDKTKVAKREKQEADHETVTVTESEEDTCTAADLTAGDTCTTGVPGTGPSHFYAGTERQNWSDQGSSSIAVGPGGIVYVGDFRRVQEFEPDGNYIGKLNLPGAQFVSALAVDASGHVYANSAAVNELQQIDIPGSGTFTLTFEEQTTAPLASGAGRAAIQEALEALSKIGHGGVQVKRGGEEAYVEFIGRLGATDVPQMTASAGSVETLIEGAPGELVELGPSSEVLQTFDESGEPTHIALDSAGDLFVCDLDGSRAEPEPTGEFQFRAYRPDGTLYAAFTSDQAPRFVAGIAIGDAAGKLYATSDRLAVISLPEPGPPAAAEEKVTDIEPTTATLHAVVNPSEFDTHYHFEYVDQTSFDSEGGFSSPHTRHLSSVDLGSVFHNYPVQAAISALIPGTVYHYRVVAESSEGTVYGADETFESLPSTSVRNFTTQTVGPELVTLKAELNPNGQSATYLIHYGTGAGDYSVGSAEGSLAIGNEFEEVTATFQGLQPNTEYHYQLVAVSANREEVETTDQVFRTEESAAEERADESCPNTNLREEDDALALPDCRDYEQVSPVDKSGSFATLLALAPHSDRILYGSLGSFADAVQDELFIEYLAQRTTAGWVTHAVVGQPSTDVIPGTAVDYSPELDRWIFSELKGLSAEQARIADETGYYSMGFASGSYLLHASPTITLTEGASRSFFYFMGVHGQSDDLSHLFIVTASKDLPTDPRPEYGEGSDSKYNRIYEVFGADGPEPTMKLVASAEVPLSLGGPTCTTDGVETLGRLGARVVSAEGSTLFYTVPIEKAEGALCGEGNPNPIGLFARIGENEPIQLNAPPASQCTSPHPCASGALATPLLDATSPDGSRAWFTTTQPLVNSDTDSTNDLYLANLDIESGQLKELTQVSAGEAAPGHSNPGEGAGVKGVVTVSQDGSHAAFVATGALTTHENELHQVAAQGADNLYVYDADSGEIRFVSELCSEDGKSGSVTDPACPEKGDDDELWRPGAAPEAHFTPDGRDLLFTSYGRLTPDDTDNVRDVYRYDFQTNQLLRVSFGHDGNDGNGNDNSYPATVPSGGDGSKAYELAEDTERSISEDGSVVIFETKAPLVSHDTNEASDLYEWEEQGHGTCHETGGCIRLVSDGLDPHGAGSGVISSSGNDIVFETDRGLVPGDTDGVGDVYDARVDGGFHAERPSSPCGSPEACRPAPRAAPSPPTLGTPNFVGPGNSTEHLRCADGKRRVVRHGQPRCVAKHQKKAHHKAKQKHHKAKHKRAAVSRGGVK